MPPYSNPKRVLDDGRGEAHSPVVGKDRLLVWIQVAPLPSQSERRFHRDGGKISEPRPKIGELQSMQARQSGHFSDGEQSLENIHPQQTIKVGESLRCWPGGGPCQRVRPEVDVAKHGS